MDSPNSRWLANKLLSLHQATLLALDVEPTTVSTGKYPDGYEPLLQAITTAVEFKSIEGSIELEVYEHPMGGNYEDGTVDVHKSRLYLNSFRQWLITEAIESSFFSTTGRETPEYLDPNHPHYAPKLAAIVSAWLALKNTDPKTSPKKALKNWLVENREQFGLPMPIGLSEKDVFSQLASVGNWQTKGGAPKTSG